MFAAEYAGQFEAVLPGLTRFGLPLPLGGSSNHFRTDVLRAIGAWDSYNVTEDADLGIRLARFGYRSASFASVTSEEAPITFDAWLHQRSRWMKGWMQTWCVHMRRPWRLWRDAGWRGVLTLNMLVGGSVLTALVHPLLWAYLVLRLVQAVASGLPAIEFDAAFAAYLVLIVTGYAGSAAVAMIGLARRGRWRDARCLWGLPIYWLYLSAAAWRALGQIVRMPSLWEKTEHGVAERPPLAVSAMATPSAVKLRDTA